MTVGMLRFSQIVGQIVVVNGVESVQKDDVKHFETVDETFRPLPKGQLLFGVWLQVSLAIGNLQKQ